ncbi:division/cell wall cluster transcriptional repressor MraZ [Sphingomonas sp. S1-29]|uniref:division/cell wall cluster transcriptional repressor MraZ n=1 Tax=Sphingomonas sp. S1-29 TaxID=2991074 RepID=UPI00223F5718|nr:division/cell wall cluster transcriptional repressor MraZ [Sphingomonas sp. S1-29]UZK69269.1 division/cell wall cluster transcriptional repressor MraZ [Sphingomonas sp. S1-29]
MADRELFYGFTLQSVDDKGRVAIPADLRVVLDRNTPPQEPPVRTVLVGRDAALNCLLCYDVTWARQLNDDFNHLRRLAAEQGRPFDEKAERRANRVEIANYDPSGRFVLPAYERQRAGIGKWAFFAGDGDRFQVWAPETLLAAEIDDPDLQDRCRFYMAQKKVVL